MATRPSPIRKLSSHDGKVPCGFPWTTTGATHTLSKRRAALGRPAGPTVAAGERGFPTEEDVITQAIDEAQRILGGPAEPGRCRRRGGPRGT